MALIANRKPRLYTVHANVVLKDAEGNPRKDAHGHLRFGNRRLVLKPGINNVKDDLWELMRTNAGLRKRIARDELEVLEERSRGEVEDDKREPDEAAEAAAIALTDLNAKEARALIRETIDRDVLAAWLEIEERSTVRSQIEKQLDKVSEDTKGNRVTG